VLTLIGGKLTTARQSALEGVRILAKMAGLEFHEDCFRGRYLPGTYQFDGHVSEFLAQAASAGVPTTVAVATALRLGGRVRAITEKGDFTLIAGRILRGEILEHISSSQAETLEDIALRRLDLPFAPDYGFSALDEIASMLRTHRPTYDPQSDIARYRERIEKVRSVLRS